MVQVAEKSPDLVTNVLMVSKQGNHFSNSKHYATATSYTYEKIYWAVWEQSGKAANFANKMKEVTDLTSPISPILLDHHPL